MSALEASSIPNSTEAGDPLRSLRKVAEEDLGISPSHTSDSDLLAIARVSEIVGTRGCRLSACAIAAVVKQTGLDKKGKGKASFGLDGSLVQFYPRFEERVRVALRDLLGEEAEGRVEIGLAKDGSGVGGSFPSSRPLYM
jgi:hexokinase